MNQVRPIILSCYSLFQFNYYICVPYWYANLNQNNMLVISTREFRQKQKMYLDLVDKNEQVIVQRGKNKAYILTLITETDRYFSDPEIKMRIAHSLEQAERGELTTLPKKDINKFLGV